MDHMPHSQGCRLPPFDVPLLPYTPYDFLGLEGFAARRGFMLNGALDETLGSQKLASLVQSWLYFGLLSDVLGRLVGPTDFGLFPVTEMGSESCSLLSLHKVPALLDGWQHNLRSLGVGRCDEELSRVRGVIQQAVASSLICDDVVLDTAPYATVSLSIKIMIMTLVFLYNGTYPIYPIDLQDKNLYPLRSNKAQPSPAAKLLAKRMEQAGRCPQAIRRICASYNYATVFYLAGLALHRDSNHSTCTEDGCIAFNTNDGTYATKHVNADCSCEHIGVDQARIESIIEEGEVPLIRFKKSSTGEMKLSVTKRGSLATSYCATSHVWCDGLGNSRQNSLPKCQILRLSELVAAARSTHLWIDTLCIPVGAGKQGLRTVAINAMASIYNDARSVIVLDAEIQQFLQHCLGDGVSRNTELLAYILTSAWNTRCWTYQEAVLGNDCMYDVTSALVVPQITDVRFGPGLNTTSPGLRWALWRGIARPRTHLVLGARFLFALVPVSGPVTFPFRMCCGPQAWKSCCEAVRFTLSPHRVSVASLPISFLWLLVACVASAVMFPAAMAVTLNAFFITILASGGVLLYILAAVGSQPMPTAATLAEQMRFSLASDMIAELQPRYIGRIQEIHQNELIANRRMMQFVHNWNSMLSRTTTKAADLHCILAALANIVPFRITALETSAERMRGIISCFELLPLQLLLSSAGLDSASVDPWNPWLPVAPYGDHLEIGLNGAHMRLADGEISIDLSSIQHDFFTLESTQNGSHTGPLQLRDPVSGLTFSEIGSTPNENDSQGAGIPHEVCYLIERRRDLSLSRSAICRAAELGVQSRCGSSIYCKFNRVMDLQTGLQAGIDAHSSPLTSTPHGKVIKIPFNISTTSPKAYRQPIGIYDCGPLLGAGIPLFFLGLAIWMAVLGSQISWKIVYIGLPIVIAIILVGGFVAVLCVGRLQAARLDERTAPFEETRVAKFITAWLSNVAQNFKQEAGVPETWYQYMLNGSMRGKRSY